MPITKSLDLTLRVVSEEYSGDNVTVTLEWTQFAYATYNAIVVPTVPIVFIGSTSCRLTILYNTEYNLNVEAVAPCRPNATAYRRFYYGEIIVLMGLIIQ